MNELYEKLKKEVDSIYSELSNEEVDSERYKILQERLDKQIQIMQSILKEERKHDMECDKAERDIESQKAEQDNRVRDLNQKKWLGIGDLLIKTAGIMATTAVSIWWVKTGLEFEESGTFTTNTIKEGIRKLPFIGRRF